MLGLLLPVGCCDNAVTVGWPLARQGPGSLLQVKWGAVSRAGSAEKQDLLRNTVVEPCQECGQAQQRAACAVRFRAVCLQGLEA